MFVFPYRSSFLSDRKKGEHTFNCGGTQKTSNPVGDKYKSDARQCSMAACALNVYTCNLYS